VISRRLGLACGLTYHLLEWEHPATTTFVLVHGFTDLGFGWIDVAERLAPHGHVIAPDLRGHGDSDWIGPGGYYHFFDYIADLDEVIARTARERLVLVGHSMGGSVCGYWAGTRPERLAGLVLLEGLGPPDASATEPTSRTANWIDGWRTGRSKGRIMASLEEAMARLRKFDPLLTEPMARRMAIAGTREVPGGVTWKHDPLHMTMGPYPYRLDVALRFWRKVTCPVVIVDGEQSRLNLPLAERAERRAAFANHRHVVVPEAGHALQRHQPDAIAALILGIS
jgi:pimeloyl-ACP methyl ester carboxylesterase